MSRWSNYVFLAMILAVLGIPYALVIQGQPWWQVTLQLVTLAAIGWYSGKRDFEEGENNARAFFAAMTPEHRQAYEESLRAERERNAHDKWDPPQIIVG